jgi:outer membrane protein, multidrug efflux system
MRTLVPFIAFLLITAPTRATDLFDQLRAFNPYWEKHAELLHAKAAKPIHNGVDYVRAHLAEVQVVLSNASTGHLDPEQRASRKELSATKLDVMAARADFYPALRLTAGFGLNAYDASLLTETRASLLYNVAGDLVAPLINRNAIKAAYANAAQMQAVYDYERTVLTAYVEVSNQLSNIENLRNSYALRSQQVEALTSSITISNKLFRSARADHMEVLLTQRDSLGSRFELVETQKQRMSATVDAYRSLGGGWR